MAILPTTQDVTQFLGSSVGKPVDFNPMQQTSANMMPAPHPQQPMQMPPSPYMPSGGPYNPYSRWARLMGGPNMQTGQAVPQTLSPGMPMSRPPMMSGGPSGMAANPSMMSGMFSHMPMVK